MDITWQRQSDGQPRYGKNAVDQRIRAIAGEVALALF